MFPTNQTFFVAFQGQPNMTMLPHSSEPGFIYKCLEPYKDMVNYPIYPKRLRIKLKYSIRFIKNLSLLFRDSVKKNDNTNSYAITMAKDPEELEKIEQELDNSIK